MHVQITFQPCFMVTGLKEKLKRFLLLGESQLLMKYDISLPPYLTPPPPPAQHKFFLLNKTPAINSGSAIHGQDPILKGSKFMTKTGSGEFLDEAL